LIHCIKPQRDVFATTVGRSCCLIKPLFPAFIPRYLRSVHYELLQHKYFFFFVKLELD